VDADDGNGVWKEGEDNIILELVNPRCMRDLEAADRIIKTIEASYRESVLVGPGVGRLSDSDKKMWW
jgi:hypothetical protein